jgi:hypothetical protein
MKLFNVLLHIISGVSNLLRFKLSKNYREKQLALFKKKLDICESCEYFNPTMRQCNECGCFVDAKTKARYDYDEEGFAISYKDPTSNEIFYACPKKYW